MEQLWEPNPEHKVHPPDEYPPEDGRYLRGNDLSPMAVCVILKWREDEIPPSIETLVRTGVESGAALAGTLQTENIGLEKMICNVVANPNIRYLIITGPESPGHLTGQAVVALIDNGVDENSRIIGAEVPTPYLYNIPDESIERFRKQLRVVDLIDEGDPAVVREAVAACCQEEPTAFKDYELFDAGAFPAGPICSPVTWKIRQPTYAPKNEEERDAAERLQDRMAEIEAKIQGKKQQEKDNNGDHNSPD
ncbi:MAG: tetrahydromethanopterin S-methyltransferase subunit A [Armatimonadota bacterium]